MNRNRVYVFIIILSAFLTPFLAGEDLPVLIITPLLGLGEMSKNQARIYNESLRTFLIQSNRLKVVDDIGSTEKGEPLTLEQATALGKNKNADFVLYGTINKEGNDIHLNVTLLNPVTGDNLLAEQLLTQKESMETDLKLLSEKVVHQASIVSFSSLDYLKAYMGSKNWERAWETYVNYKRTVQEIDPVVENYGRKIAVNLARSCYDDAVNLLKSGSFDNARSSVARALELDPGKAEYEALKVQIEKEYTAYKENEKEAVLAAINELVREERYRSADVMMARLENAGFAGDSDVIIIRNEVDRGIEELDYYQAARNSFAKHDYVAARLKLNNAMRLNPDKADYADFLKRINHREELELRNKRTWDRYSVEISSLNPFSLFVEAKNPYRFISLSYIFWTLSYSAVDGTTIDQPDIAMRGVEVSYFHYFDQFIPFLKFDSEIFSLKPTVVADISFARGTEKDALTGGGIAKSSGTVLNLGGTGGLSMTGFSFTLGAGLSLQTGAFVKSYNEVYPYGDGNETQSALWNYSLGVGFDSWLAWYPVDRIQLSLRYRRILLKLWGQDPSLLDPGYSIFSIGFGARVF